MRWVHTFFLPYDIVLRRLRPYIYRISKIGTCIFTFVLSTHRYCTFCFSSPPSIGQQGSVQVRIFPLFTPTMLAPWRGVGAEYRLVRETKQARFKNQRCGGVMIDFPSNTPEDFDWNRQRCPTESVRSPSPDYPRKKIAWRVRCTANKEVSVCIN